MLTLAEVEQRHDGGLLVLGRIALDDLIDDGLVFRAELEGNIGVVLGGVSVLDGAIVSFLDSQISVGGQMG